MIHLTKNERKTLKLLLNNSRMSDSDIASELGISSQAVGKIRKKLESSLVKQYTLSLDYSKLGIHTFAIGIAKLTRSGLDKGELEVEQILLENAHIIQVYRLPRGSSTHILLFGFCELSELDTFFHTPQIRKELHNFIEIQEIYTFSHNSVVKNDPMQLYCKVIDGLSNEGSVPKFAEIEIFKDRLQ